MNAKVKSIGLKTGIRILLFSSLFFLTENSFSQSKKDIKTSNIRSITVNKYDYKSGKEIKLKESVTKYDANGNVTDEIKYNDQGKFLEHFGYMYNSNDDKISETEYDEAGKVKKISKYTYKNNLKVEKNTYDPSNKLISKKEFLYTFDKD
jgi:hypothetical protein